MHSRFCQINLSLYNIKTSVKIVHYHKNAITKVQIKDNPLFLADRLPHPLPRKSHCRLQDKRTYDTSPQGPELPDSHLQHARQPHKFPKSTKSQNYNFTTGTSLQQILSVAVLISIKSNSVNHLLNFLSADFNPTYDLNLRAIVRSLIIG